MKKVTTLILALTISIFAACVSTQDCRVTDLRRVKRMCTCTMTIRGMISGEFTAQEDNYVLTEIDSRIQCSDINLAKFISRSTRTADRLRAACEC